MEQRHRERELIKSQTKSGITKTTIENMLRVFDLENPPYEIIFITKSGRFEEKGAQPIKVLIKSFHLFKNQTNL